jgi:hypothetical protein
MSRWFRRPVLGLALLAVVTAACSVHVTGAPAAGSASTRSLADPGRIHAEDALGDLSLWNPCSVVIPDELPEEWSTLMYTPVAYEYCAMDVATEGDTTAGEVQVGYLYRSTHDLKEHESGKRAGGITVVRDEEDADACTNDIVFADGIALVVRVLPVSEDDMDAMCDVSDVVADKIIDAVQAGQAETLELPENSLGGLDPCEVVKASMITLVPGLTADIEAERQVSRHSCWWESPDGIMLNVDFNIGYMPEGDSGQTSHGRYTAVTRYDDSDSYSLCAVDGEHVPFEHRSDSELMERVTVWVYLKPGQVEDACTAASGVANVLWPELPPLD